MKHILLRPKEAEELRSIIKDTNSSDRNLFTIIDFYNCIIKDAPLLQCFLDDEDQTRNAKRFNFVLEELYQMFLSGDIKVKENKFYLKSHLPNDERIFLNKCILDGTFVFNDRNQNVDYQTEFTQEEIDELIKKYGDEIKALEKIPV
ncbi:hypothetical protein vBOeSunk162_47 [Oenococcus phage vB_OeS_unk162]|nr:hypothetical protein vBOeSunk162_47 [Oenococcus phage vB_OeS_unk162]